MASPLIANVYLHYLFDLHGLMSGAGKWRRAMSSSFAMPTILCWAFSSGLMRVRFLEEFEERLAKFGLELHPDKTRLIRFWALCGP